MRRFAVDIMVQIGEYDGLILPVNTFIFTKEDNENFEIKDIYCLSLGFISKSGGGYAYNDLMVEGTKCGFCIPWLRF